MFEFKACEVLKAKELTHVNDWFQNERNAEVGHYRQALNNFITIKHIVENKDKTLTKDALFEIHKLITHKTLDNQEDEGRYRAHNKINVVDVVDGEIVHTPPE